MIVELDARQWPDQCCVPAFVHAALLRLGVACPVPEALPGILGVRVPPGQENPLGLPLSDDEHPAGVTAVDAERAVNRMCRELNLPIRLRRVPFLTITFDLWEDVLAAALDRGAVVGIGVDYRVLAKADPLSSAQHVLRVVSLQEDALELFDDSGESNPPRLHVDRDRVHRAVLAISDGLWIMGRERDLTLPYTLPWSDGP